MFTFQFAPISGTYSCYVYCEYMKKICAALYTVITYRTAPTSRCPRLTANFRQILANDSSSYLLLDLYEVSDPSF